jgi:hypothetical protein
MASFGRGDDKTRSNHKAEDEPYILLKVEGNLKIGWEIDHTDNSGDRDEGENDIGI